jgi:hypothetical protein
MFLKIKFKRSINLGITKLTRKTGANKQAGVDDFIE